MGDGSQFFTSFLLSLYKRIFYIKLVVVEIKIEGGNNEVFNILLEMVEFLELTVDFRHLLEQKPGYVIFVLDLNVGIGTTRLKRGLRRGTPSWASCSRSSGRFLTICLLGVEMDTFVLNRVPNIFLFCRGWCWHRYWLCFG